MRHVDHADTGQCLGHAVSPLIARQTRSGVTGISICVTPNSASASTTALTRENMVRRDAHGRAVAVVQHEILTPPRSRTDKVGPNPPLWATITIGILANVNDLRGSPYICASLTAA